MMNTYSINITEQDMHTILAALCWYRNGLPDTGPTSSPSIPWSIVSDIAIGGDRNDPRCVSMTRADTHDLEDRLAFQAWPADEDHAGYVGDTTIDAKAALEAAHDRRQSNPHNKRLQGRPRDEDAALDAILRSLPRCATEISLGVAYEDSDPGFLQSTCEIDLEQEDFEPIIKVLIDGRRTHVRQVAEMLRAAAARIEEEGMLVSVARSPYIGDDRLWYVEEFPDGSVRGGPSGSV
jgi:hypothetical protein